MKFALKNKDIDCIKADLEGNELWFELYKLNDDWWTLIEHDGNHSRECMSCYVKDWEILWKMLTEK
jgi:hypothetical protein